MTYLLQARLAERKLLSQTGVMQEFNQLVDQVEKCRKMLDK